jgi:acyl-CoA synthetase (AMP-forming)/AMP-acid ligase II
MQVGLIVSAIDGRYVDKRFDGYGDAAATEKKVLRDVFREGDTYFNTGDLMYRDRLGFFYWADRTGDTFRWKGENVSTCEVAAVIMGPSEKNASIVGTALTDAVVYGVAVPGQDGRAGMAALRLSKADSSLTPRDTDADSADVDVTKPLVESMLAELDNRMTAGLPAYARPRFFRITNRIVVTTTYKYQKGDLIKEVKVYEFFLNLN